MKLKDAPYKSVKIYDISEQDINQFKLDVNSLPTMIRPNLADYNKFLNRASVGLCETKKRNGDLICFNRVGLYKHRSNVYSDNSNAFDIIQEGHIDMVDADNTDGIECVTDFYLTKKRLTERLVDEVRPIVTNFIHMTAPPQITIANFSKVGNLGFYIQKNTVEFQVIAKRGIGSIFDPSQIDMESIRRPLSLNFSYGIRGGSKKNMTIGIHPKKYAKGSDKTMVDSSLSFYRSKNATYGYGNNYRNSYYDKAPFISLTEIDVDKFFHEFISAYNSAIKDFNDEVENLMEKYVALFMLNSVGLQSSII